MNRINCENGATNRSKINTCSDVEYEFIYSHERMFALSLLSQHLAIKTIITNVYSLQAFGGTFKMALLAATKNE